MLPDQDKKSVHYDTTSIDDYTSHTHNESLDLFDVNDTASRSQWLVDRYKDPEIRVSRMEILPQVSVAP